MKINLPKITALAFEKPVMFWFLGCLSLIVGVQAAYYYGAIQLLYTADVTKLSIVITGIFVWQSLCCAFSLYHVTKYGRANSLNRNLERGWFYSDIVLSIGMVGTVIGFIMMLTGFSDLNFEDTSEVQALISKLGYGMSTALATTLVGLISSVVLKLQFFLLETTMEKEKNKLLI